MSIASQKTLATLTIMAYILLQIVVSAWMNRVKRKAQEHHLFRRKAGFFNGKADRTLMLRSRLRRGDHSEEEG
jgi:hypothetical protein